MAKWIAFSVLIACTVLLAEAQRHLENYTYVTYRINTMCSTQSRQSCHSSWWGGDDCNTVYYCQYYAVNESVNATGTRCQRGWSPFDECNVLNPCEAGTSGCEQRCVYGGTNGSYTCSCNPEYELADDGHKCKDIDECKTLANACNQTENFVCQNTVGGYECDCKEGFNLTESRQCLDIDECDILEDNCTTYENLTCENTIGSYKCNCPVGFENSDKFHCVRTEEHAGFLSLSRGGQIGVIAAIVIGGVLVITLVVVAIVVCCRKKRKIIIDNGSNQLDDGARRTTEENVYESPDIKITSTAKMKLTKIFSRRQKSSNISSSSGVTAGSQEPRQGEPLQDVRSFYEDLSRTLSPTQNQDGEKPYEGLRPPLEDVEGETYDVNTSDTVTTRE